ncbi:MAG TPA: Holliday junction resolvase RecU [Haloplasmataceae bacterium]
MNINYPIKKMKYNEEINYAHRGMSLENELNESNKYYKAHNIALIYKKPTPVQIVKVDYPRRQKAVIREAYFQAPSTTDYNGIYRQKYIDFEAKEIASKTAFPLQNIHLHQIQHIKQVISLGGIAFIIVRFTHHNKTFLLDGSITVDLYEKFLQNGPKSISIKLFLEKGMEITDKCITTIDYLKVVDKLYFNEE